MSKKFSSIDASTNTGKEMDFFYVSISFIHSFVVTADIFILIPPTDIE